MSVREQFVIRALEPGTNFSALCREYGVSRKTGYKWVERYEQHGLRGLEDLSRRPDNSPLKASADVVAEVVRLRMRYPRRGGRKFRKLLARSVPEEDLPSERTINRILERAGFFQPARRPRRRKNSPTRAPKLSPQASNDLWTVDFKGWWRALNQERCEPLTVRDAYSRFVLAVDVMPSTGMKPVWRAFDRLFESYGLPKAILSDNGVPWVTAHGTLGLTKLSVWWLSLGIEHHRTRPGKPCDNGGHERMHRDIAEELEAFAALSRAKQQHACDLWRHDFNHHRPHEALSDQTPGEIYRRSPVEYRGGPTAIEYPDGFAVRLVSHKGYICMNNKRMFLSNALSKQRVGLQHRSPQVFSLWFAHQLLGEADFTCHPPVVRGEL